MSKTAIKKQALEQGRLAPGLTVIDGDLSLVDIHRHEPRAKGGTYTEDNSILLTPEAHMKLHDTWRDREPTINNLKILIDDRNQIIKIRNKVNNQLLAYKRGTDHQNEATVQWLESQAKTYTVEVAERDKALKRFMKRIAKENPLAKAALGVKGVAEVTVAYCLVYIDPTKARHASSVWKYAGLHCANHERYKAGEAGGGNKTLRTVLFTMADSQMKGRTRGAAYGEIYDRIKGRLEVSEKTTKSRFAGDKGTAPREVMWKDAKPSHRHGAALRGIMKHFLADYWFVARTIAGLPTDSGYAEDQLGKNHLTIKPQERGWIF